MFLYLLFNNNSNLLIEKIRIASFNVVSILSGTGYVTMILVYGVNFH